MSLFRAANSLTKAIFYSNPTHLLIRRTIYIRPCRRNVAYTDGSCIYQGEKNAMAGAGVYRPNAKVKYICGRVPGIQDCHCAELHACCMAIAQSIEEGETDILVVSDSTTVGWAVENSANYQTENEKFRVYMKYIERMKKKITVEVEHVKGHSGDFGNEKADKLARCASGQVMESLDFDTKAVWYPEASTLLDNMPNYHIAQNELFKSVLSSITTRELEKLTKVASKPEIGSSRKIRKSKNFWHLRKSKKSVKPPTTVEVQSVKDCGAKKIGKLAEPEYLITLSQTSQAKCPPGNKPKNQRNRKNLLSSLPNRITSEGKISPEEFEVAPMKQVTESSDATYTSETVPKASKNQKKLITPLPVAVTSEFAPKSMKSEDREGFILEAEPKAGIKIRPSTCQTSKAVKSSRVTSV